MASAQRVALPFFVFASSMMMMMMISFSDAADHVSREIVLYTNTPYYMMPPKTNGSNWGGFAPRRIGNIDCPSAIVFTPGNDKGIPIMFTVPNGDTIPIFNARIEVFISFVGTPGTPCNHRRTWGRTSRDTWSSHFVRLVTHEYFFEPARFRMFRLGNGFRVFGSFIRDGAPVTASLMPRFDSENGITRLALEVSQDSYYNYFEFVRASNYDGDM